MNVNQPVVLKQQPKLPAIMEEFNQTKSLCMELLKTKHYQQMGEAGIFAIVQKANSLSINPMDALNGGMYFVQGKVELSAIMMAKLIRGKCHSYTLGKESTPTNCVLHGKRKDNGDTWKVSFSVEDAKRAGIYKQGGPWTKYPDIMCYNRALSKLARQLFPDVIGNCYVEGEISDAPPLYDQPKDGGDQQTDIVEAIYEKTTAEPDRVLFLRSLVGDDEEKMTNLQDFISKKFKVSDIDQLNGTDCEWVIDKLEASKSKAEGE